MELQGKYQAEIFWRKNGPRAKLVYNGKTRRLTFYAQNVDPIWFPMYSNFEIDDFNTISQIDDMIGREARRQIFEMLHEVIVRAIEDLNQTERLRKALPPP